MGLTGFVIFVVLSVTVQIIAGTRHKRLNKKQLVVASWGGLRITRTELIKGYKRSAKRYRLRGLTAWAERDNDRICVVVEGPDISIVEFRPINELLAKGKVWPSAHEFAAALNLASHQA